VVLMDVQMPAFDGLQANRKLRQMTPIIQPVVIAMTANAYNEDRTACLAANMDYFLAKPVTLNALRTDGLTREFNTNEKTNTLYCFSATSL